MVFGRDRPRRAPDHNPPARRAVRLPCRRRTRGVGSVVRIPFGRQSSTASWSALAETTEVPAERLVAPTAVRDGPCPRTWSSSRCGWRTSTARRRRGRSRSCSRRPGGRARSCGRERDRGAARRRAADRQPARAARPRCPRPRAATSRALRRLEARGLVDDRAARRAGARRAPTPAADRAVELTRRAGGGGRRGRARAARTCCTASPARARPRSTCAPRPRRSRAARA